MKTAHLVESLGEKVVNLGVTDKGKLRIGPNQNIKSNKEIEMKTKARYTFDDETDLFYYGACPECGKEGQLNNINSLIWSYCGEHNTAWHIPLNPDDPQGVPYFCQQADERNYKIVAPIMTKLETPENKAAMLEEMKARTVIPISEIHLVDEEILDKKCYGLHHLPDSCTVQVRFEECLSKLGILNHLKLIVDKLEKQFDAVNDPYLNDLPF